MAETMQSLDQLSALKLAAAPETVHTMSYWPLRLAATSGCWINMRSTGRAK